jgi:hypothetical protein
MFHPNPPSNPLLTIMQAIAERMRGTEQPLPTLPPTQALPPLAPPLLNRPSPARIPFLESSFVQDTLHPMIGGAPRLVQSDLLTSLVNTLNRMPWSDYNGNVEGFAVPFVNMVGFPEGGEPHPRTYIHEAGHIADFRNSLPLDLIAKQHFNEFRQTHPTAYGATNSAEYKAEMLEFAIELIRGSGRVPNDLDGGPPAWIEKRLQEYNMPGLRETIGVILDLPIFAEHPVRARFARHQLPAMQAQPPQR